MLYSIACCFLLVIWLFWSPKVRNVRNNVGMHRVFRIHDDVEVMAHIRGLLSRILNVHIRYDGIVVSRRKTELLISPMKWTRRKVSQSPKVSSGPAFSELYNWTHEQPLNTGGVQQYYLLNFFFATGIQPDPASGHGWRLQGLVCFLRLLEAIVHSSKRPLSRQVAMRVLRPRFPQLLLQGLHADHSRSAETKKMLLILQG